MVEEEGEGGRDRTNHLNRHLQDGYLNLKIIDKILKFAGHCINKLTANESILASFFL